MNASVGLVWFRESISAGTFLYDCGKELNELA